MYLAFYSCSFSYDCAWEKCFLGQCVFIDTALQSVASTPKMSHSPEVQLGAWENPHPNIKTSHLSMMSHLLAPDFYTIYAPRTDM